jgi:uncharacterized tellurite resistance protein B-like protein
MNASLYKEAMLCLMFAVVDADKKLDNDELVECITMKDVFNGYSEQQIIALYNEYKKRFSDKGFSETAAIFVQQIPAELHMATLSIMADIAVIDFDVDMQEGSFISIVANAMGIAEVSVKTLLLAALSKKLLMDMNETPEAGLN